MAYWRTKEADFNRIAALLEATPGISARELARKLDVAPSTVTRCLPSLEEAGILLCEDESGRLQVVGRRK